ncbi:MAG: OmpA family protein [Candidatus Kapaibacterium sp.]|nr:OmpA family protein [Bacteroidota bacterium]
MRYFIILFAILCTISVQAQLHRSAYGIYTHFNYAMHDADFQSLPNLPCCSQHFTDGTGNGIALGILYQTPHAPTWTLSGRLGYISYPGTLINNESKVVNVGGNPVLANIQHQIDASLSSINLEPLIGYRITDRFTLHGGLSIGAVMKKTFVQTEELTQPTQGALTVPTLVGSGDIQNASSLYAGVMAGASFDIPLFHGSRWFLAPEVFYVYSIANVASDIHWKVNMLRAGFALKYSPSPVDLPPQPDTQKVKLIAAVQAFGLNSPQASPEPVVRIKIEEFLSRTHKPLLPYIFFGNGSAEFPLQYNQLQPQETQAFTPERFNDSSLIGVYYDMLNIIGKRMKEKPSASITLTGCNSNEGVEKGNSALSQKRAETVKNYLTSVWGIEPQRITVKSRNLPANPSNIAKEEGLAENRRVEISTNTPEIIAPLITRDTTRVSTPPIVRFETATESQAGEQVYSLATSQNHTLLQAFNGNGKPPEHIDWHIEDNPVTIPRAETPLQYNLRVTDKIGQDYTTTTADIPVEQLTIAKKRREKLGDKEIVRYTLMSFGYNQADVEPDNMRYLNEIKQEITPASTVRISGSTDTMGDEDFNQTLSEQRAKSTAKVLKANNAQVYGVGEQVYFDNSLPEGRFYNRTVRIVIENPVK